MIEILSGILTGSAMGKEVGSMLKTWDRPVDTGHFFIAVNIERFMPRQAFLQRVDTLLSWITEVPLQPGVGEILYPGQTRARTASQYEQEGIPLSQETVQSVEELAESLHIPSPWRD
jgi:LDH2 family malate/lactate/ureidoglycolate dehydrogenase